MTHRQAQQFDLQVFCLLKKVGKSGTQGGVPE